MSDSNPILAALARLETGQADVATAIGGLETRLTGLRTDLMARMDRLQEAQARLFGDVTVNFANTERTDRRAQAAHDEIRLVMEMVSELVRSTRRLETRVTTLEQKSDGPL